MTLTNERLVDLVRLSCIVATRVPEICLAPNCPCYKEHGKPTVKAITDALTREECYALAESKP